MRKSSHDDAHPTASATGAAHAVKCGTAVFTLVIFIGLVPTALGAILIAIGSLL